MSALQISLQAQVRALFYFKYSKWPSSMLIQIFSWSGKCNLNFEALCTYSQMQKSIMLVTLEDFMTCKTEIVCGMG
jgi:hypothetical protein